MDDDDLNAYSHWTTLGDAAIGVVELFSGKSPDAEAPGSFQGGGALNAGPAVQVKTKATRSRLDQRETGQATELR
jgi:hypothetical protein